MSEPPVTGEPAYKLALEELRRGRYAVMVPGVHRGSLAVYSRFCRLSGDARRAALSDNPTKRAMLMIGVCRMVREEAAAHGMVF